MCFDTRLFRKLARTLPQQGEVAVEIGCSFGKCTNVLGKVVGANAVVAVDISKVAVTAARTSYPDLAARFHVVDVLRTPHIVEDMVKDAREAVGASCTSSKPASSVRVVAFVDIGGNRELEALTALLPWVQRTLQPRVCVVKSEALHTFMWSRTQGPDAHGCWSLPLGTVGWAELQRLATAAIASRREHATNSKRPPGGVRGRDTREDGDSAAGAGNGAGSGAGSGAGGAAGTSKRRRVMHPLKAPLRKTQSGVPICRYHNYDPRRGCLKYRRKTEAAGEAADRAAPESTCPLDHDHCHACGEKGHVAYECDCERVQPLIG